VLISKNQAWNIERLTASVLHATAGRPATEIVLVDSASTDDTVDRACAYPITVLRLHPDQPLTPAAGRWVGYRHTHGARVLFLDGDMELCPGWLEQAGRVLDTRPDAAAVTGQIVDLPKTAGPGDKPPRPPRPMGAPVPVPFAGGAALYRRAVLEQVGCFNPYANSDEEPELGVRIRHADYCLLRIPYPLAYHYTAPSGALPTLVGRWRRNLFLGVGQNMRSLLGTPFFRPYLRERGYGCVPALVLTAGAAGVLWAVRRRGWAGVTAWALLGLAGVAGDAIRKRSLYRTLHSLLERVFIMDGMVRGFLQRPADPAGYPGRLDVIRRATPPAWPLEPHSLRAVPEVRVG
jgi:GT2 family glycosyltransferase